jgi:hypothetical protein
MLHSDIVKIGNLIPDTCDLRLIPRDLRPAVCSEQEHGSESKMQRK